MATLPHFGINSIYLQKNIVKLKIVPLTLLIFQDFKL